MSKMSRNVANSLEILKALVPPPSKPKSADADRKRAAVEAQLDTALPDDLFVLSGCYGSGFFGTAEFSDVLEVFNPFSKSYGRDVKGILEICAEHKRIEGNAYIPFDLHPS